MFFQIYHGRKNTKKTIRFQYNSYTSTGLLKTNQNKTINHVKRHLNRVIHQDFRSDFSNLEAFGNKILFSR